VHLTHHLMPEAIRSQSVVLLNNHLAAAIDLHAQVKQAHWNVRGPGFFPIHELFAKVSSEVEEFSDQLAERTAALAARRLEPFKLLPSKRSSRRIRSASPMSIVTSLRLRERWPHSTGQCKRPAHKRPRLAIRRLPIYSNRSRAPWTWSCVLSTPISPQYQQRHECLASI
jgi:hypothetical protein